jgi:Zn-dependent protease
MMGGFKIGRLFGIDVRVNATWFLILAFLTAALATGFFPASFPGWSPVAYWAVALSASVLLFASVLVHEFAHSLVALRQGIEVKSVTLFLLGGVASIEQDPTSPGREVAMAGAGPLTSLAIGGLSLALLNTVPLPEAAAAVFLYLAVANIALAIFNMLPGFPLDGGRILRALLWRITGDQRRATRAAAWTGVVFGYGFVALGVLLLVGASGLGGAWLAFIGWFLAQASRQTLTRVEFEHTLDGVTAGALAAEPERWVPPYVTAEHAADSYFEPGEQRCLPVRPQGEDRAYDGLLCIDQLERRPPDQPFVRVADVMTGASSALEVTPETPAAEAVRLMSQHDATAVAVVKDGRLLGIVDRATILRRVHLAQNGHGGEREAKAA